MQSQQMALCAYSERNHFLKVKGFLHNHTEKLLSSQLSISYARLVPIVVYRSATLQLFNIDMPHLLNSLFSRRRQPSGAQAPFISGIVKPYRDHRFKVVNLPLIQPTNLSIPVFSLRSILTSRYDSISSIPFHDESLFPSYCEFHSRREC